MNKRLLFILMVPAVALLNYLGVQLSIFLNIPFFLDTWGTTLGVLSGGLAIGVAGGVLYNLIMMSVWGSSAWVWSFVNIWVAFIVYQLSKKGMMTIKKPGKLFVSALIVGFTTTIVIVLVLFTTWGGVETYQGVLPTYNALLDVTGNKVFAAIGEKFITTPIDQIVSIFMAAIVYSSLPDKFKLRK